MERRCRIGVTYGDAAGIGPELVCKAVAQGFLFDKAIPVLIGREDVIVNAMGRTGLKFDYRIVSSPAQAGEGPIALVPRGQTAEGQVETAVSSAQNGKDQGDILVHLIELCKMGLLDGICFAPLNKGAMKAGGYDYPSEHELFADIYGQREGFGEMNLVNGLWNIRVSSHIPFREIMDYITVENVLKAARLGFETLRRAGRESPLIALAALNPHAGENGTCGDEESTVLQAAIALAEREGMGLMGPFPADTLFARAFREKYDGVITMYHDQGQIAIKLQDFMHCVTISAGLPHPITTPAHGTAYDIAGKNLCSVTPFREAYDVCRRMVMGDLVEKGAL